MAKGRKAKTAAAGANPAKRDADIAPRVSPATYLQQVNAEGRKVVWPSWKETRQTTIMVMICVLIFGLFFFVVDYLIGIVVPWVLSFGRPS